MKRQITPHKGSRIARIEARVTVTARNQLAAILASRHAHTGKEISIADWLTEKIQEEFADLPPAVLVELLRDAQRVG